MALTKVLHFDPDVLDVLRRQTTWSEDGLSCQMEPLGPKLYQKVSKALKAMGGTWKGGKVQATLFEEDPRPRVEGLLHTGTVIVARDGFFQTPATVSRRMTELAKLKDGSKLRILEPEAGMAALAAWIRLYCGSHDIDLALDVCEKDEKRSRWLVEHGYKLVKHDFLTYDPGEVYDFVIMNPPFEEGQDCLHVIHAFNMLKPGGALVSVMGANVDYRENGAYKTFKKWLDGKKPKWEDLPQDSFKESGANFGYKLVVLHKPGAKTAQQTIRKANKVPRAPAKKGGVAVISQADTVDLNEKATGKSTSKRYGNKSVKSNVIAAAAESLILLHSKKGKSTGDVYAKQLPDGRKILSGGVPLPDPHTEYLDINNDVVEEMNERARKYPLQWFNNSHERRDEQIRSDFASLGARDKNIVLNTLDRDTPYTRVIIKQKKTKAVKS